MNDDEYHGWPNYETWITYSWLANDETTRSDTIEYVQEHLAGHHVAWCEDDHDVRTPEDLAATHTEPSAMAGEWLRPYVERYISRTVFGDEWPASLATDIIGRALTLVHWYALAGVFAE